ncbi:deoxyribodipyrimidine photo-lyase [Mucilaginibacter hurinus]|uniref:Deoxyribodipyrimidine photo-lyase n=1 Tax=Mucilaginibacter hurinus TaxID=2201324 RepID=A0A367GPS5_9SPHI|nr:deoxyribodipyrimidine photo-lyase [Mucilaginibacter hurinus]RCH54866.1 deoxyribodipyrimidine photo-lyase [Mucilaginibacter hurinus]
MANKKAVSIFWFRRDLRPDDNAGFYHALKGNEPVIPFFIFDRQILGDLKDKDDARVTFIHQAITELNATLKKHGSNILVFYDDPIQAWKKLLEIHNVAHVYANHDYEPYAKERDAAVANMLEKHNITFSTYKDQVIFESDEVMKDDGKPYTVFTPYKRKWLQTLNAFYMKSFPNKKYFKNLFQFEAPHLPALKEMGFSISSQNFPDKNYKSTIDDYAKTRDFPAVNGTSRVGMHLRFGTVSIRRLVQDAVEAREKTWLSELIWREFFMMILYHFPKTVDHAFRPEYDRIQWRNNEEEFNAWCRGETGYPLVDAGMRELNATGFMHNRVRMVTASFLSKHLLIDWRWGEQYFAQKLLDYEMSSNVGNWQWVAGSGTDAAPYFRIFNPEAQTKRFDPKMEYIKKWVPEYADFSKYPKPIVDHVFARDRCLKAFKAALSK